MRRDGVGRTGAFISTHAEIERMKAETVVDLFQFIKGMHTQRAGMVSSKVCAIHITSSSRIRCKVLLCLQEQYKFCHEVLADFLDEFDTQTPLSNRRAFE